MENSTQHKHWLRRMPEIDGFNTNFLTPANMDYFNNVALPWLPATAKPLVFLPCGSAAKTREKYGKKMISQGTGCMDVLRH